MKIALAQMKMDTDIERNFQKSLRLIREAAEKKADLICFPEIQLSPFFPQFPDCDVSEYVMTEDSSYVKGVRNACRENHIFASPNCYIEEKGHRYDMSLLIDDQGEIIGRQKMVHVAQCEMFYEQSYYTPSEEGFMVFDTRLGKIGIYLSNGAFVDLFPQSKISWTVPNPTFAKLLTFIVKSQGMWRRFAFWADENLIRKSGSMWIWKTTTVSRTQRRIRTENKTPN